MKWVKKGLKGLLEDVHSICTEHFTNLKKTVRTMQASVLEDGILPRFFKLSYIFWLSDK